MMSPFTERPMSNRPLVSSASSVREGTPPFAPVRRRLIAGAAVSLLASALTAGCGGGAMDSSKEVWSSSGNKDIGAGNEPPVATAAASATATEVPFMRVGEITPPPAEPSTPVAASSAAPESKPTDPKKGGKDKKAEAPGKPLPAGASARGNNEKANDEGGPDSPPPPPKAAVVDSTNGLSEAEVRSTIVSKQSSFRECYDIGAAAAPSFAGTIQLKVSIGPTGSVASVDVLSSTTKLAQVDSCVAQTVRKIQFPAKGNGAVVAFPIEFGR